MRALGAVAGAGLLGLLLGAPLSCRAGRFPTCQDDQECSEREEGQTKRYCVNLRCVACRVDRDCQSGEVCNRRTNECDKM